MSPHTTCASLLTLCLLHQLNAQTPPRPPIPILPNLPGSMAPLDVLCENPGPCSCPARTEQPCTINCDGVDACKDGLIECNNDGFPCTVNCMGEIACSGTTNINGPAGSSLTVNCMAEKTCEGSVYIHGDKGTDLTVACDANEACVGSIELNFGNGVGTIGCNDPHSCQGVLFNLPPNADTTPGVGFSCTGPSCPPTAPQSFKNEITASIITCDGPGPCSCPVGLKDVCRINCIGGADACKDGLIECNNDGYDCFVNCMELESCGGDTFIMGPAGAALTVQCIGEKACEGALSVDAEAGTDLTVVCEGGETCKGDIQFSFGNGAGSVWCNGHPDSCSGGAIFNLPINAETTPGVSFSCYGDFCPATAPKSFTNSPLPPTVPPQPTIPIPAPQLPPPAASLPQTAPLPLPLPIHIPPVSVGGGSWCCQTRIPNFTPHQGRCWDKQDAASCNAVIQDRCIWDETKCFQSRPICLMYGAGCSRDNQCCSEVCRTSPAAPGVCR